MARLKGNKIDGWLVIDKPPGMTSTDVVRKIKHFLRPMKIGHGGTLDPIATGILPIALGEATKTVPYVMRAAKEYDFVVQWGEARSSDDRVGEITGTSDVRPDRAAVAEAIGAFIGDIEQQPPIYSAIKVGGKRAYELARAGKLTELPPRKVHIEALQRTDQGENPDLAEFHIICGKGTYVRALARDLAQKLGTLGHIKDIRRTRVGPFDENSAISLEKLNELSHSARASEEILPVMTALDDIPELAVTRGEAVRLRHGQSLRLPTAKSGTVQLTSDGSLIALAEIQDGIVKPLRVFNLP
jgi:tRNA pseudouridine55 synthase